MDPYEALQTTRIEPTAPASGDPYAALQEGTISTTPEEQEKRFKGLQWFTDRFALGASAISKAATGIGLATNDSFEFTDAKEQFESDELMQAQAATEADRNEHTLLKLGGIKVGSSDVLGGWVIEQLPSMGLMLGGAGAGAGAAATLGLASGPIGWSALGGAALVGGTIAGGNMVYDMMERGVDRNTARGIGIWTGVAATALMGATGKAGHMTMEAAMKAAMSSSSFKTALPHLVKHVSASYGVQLGIGEVQIVSDMVSKYWATRCSKGAKPFTFEEGMKEFTERTLQNGLLAAEMAVGGTGLGALIGHVGKQVRQAELDARAKERLKQQQAAQAQAQAQAAQAGPTGPDQLALEAGRAKGRRKSSKFQNVTQRDKASVKQARQNLETAENELKRAAAGGPDEISVATYELKYAESALKEAQMDAQLKEIESALQDKDLAKSVENRREIVKTKLETVEDDIAAAKKSGASGDDLGRLYDRAKELRDEDARLRDFAKLDPAEMEATLKEMQNKLIGRLDKTKRLMAMATLKARMAKRARQIEQIKKELESGLDEIAVDETAAPTAPAVPAPPLVPEVAAPRTGDVVRLSPSFHLRFVRDLPIMPDEELLQIITNPNENYEEAVLARQELMRRLQPHQPAPTPAPPAQPTRTIPADRLAEYSGQISGSLLEIERLKELQDFDQMVQDFIAGGWDNMEEINALAAKAPRSPIARLNGIVKMAVSHIEQAAKLGANQQRSASRAIRQLLGRVIDVARLPREDRLALKDRVKNTADLKGLAEMLADIAPAIQEQFEKRQKEAALEDIKRMVGSVSFDKTERSKIPGAEEAWRSIVSLLKNPDDISQTRADLHAKIMAGTMLDAYEQATLDALNSLFPDNLPYNLKDMAATQVLAINDALADLKTTGRHNAFARSQARRAQVLQDVEDVKTAILTKPSGKRASEYDTNSWIARTKSSLHEIGSRSWSGVMKMITREGTITDFSDKFDLRVAENTYSAKHREGSTKMKEFINKGVADDKWFRYRIEWDGDGPDVYFGDKYADGTLVTRKIVRINDDVLVATFDDQTGDWYIGKNKLNPKQMGKPSVWELIQIYNYLRDKDPDAKSRLSAGNGFNYKGEVDPGMSTLECVESALRNFNPDTLKVADALREWYQWFYPTVNEVSVKRFSRQLPLNRDYGGPLLNDMLPQNRFDEVSRRFSTRPGSVLGRTGGEAPVKIKSALQVFGDHLHKFSREQAFYEFEQRAQAIFNDRDIVKIIQRKFGDKAPKVVHKFIEDMILGHYHVYSAMSDTFGWVRRMAFAKYLGLKGEQFVKQLTGAVYALQTVGPKALIEGYAALAADPQKWIGLANKSEAFQRRIMRMDPDFKGGGVPLFLLPSVWQLAKTRKGKAFQLTLDTMEYNSLHSLSTGDKYGVYLSSIPVLVKTLKETGSEAKALAAFEEAFTATQSSGELREMPAMFRGSKIERMLTLFSQQPTKQLELCWTAYEQFRSTPNKKTAAKVMQTVATAWLGSAAYNMTGGLIASIINPDDADKIMATSAAVSVLGPYAGVAVGGSAITYAWLMILSSVADVSLNIHEPGFLLTDWLGDLGTSLQKYVKLADSENLDGWHFIDALYSTYNLVLPTPTGAKQAIKGKVKEMER